MYQSTLRNPKFILSSGEISCPSTCFFDGRNPAPPDLYETPANCGIFTNLNWCNIFFHQLISPLLAGEPTPFISFFSDHFFLRSLMTPSTCDACHPNVGGLEVRNPSWEILPQVFSKKKCPALWHVAQQRKRCVLFKMRFEKTFKIKIQINCASITKILQVTACTKS